MQWRFPSHAPTSADRLRVKTILLFSCLVSQLGYGAITGVWANEGGDKVTQDELRATKGQENRTGHVINSVWNGTAISLTGAHNEEVSLNLVLENGTATPVNNVSIRFDTLNGPNGAQIHSIPATGNGVFDWTQRPIELFYVRYVQIRGLSYFGYGKWDERQIPVRFQRPYTGQGVGSGDWTSRPDHDKFYPDATVPVETIPTFAIQPHQNQSIWIDIYIPKTIPSGSYAGTISIYENGQPTRNIPISVEVKPIKLPDTPVAKTMVAVDTNDILWRYITGYHAYANWQSAEGARAAKITDRYYQLFHRHKISVIGENECPANDRPCDTSVPRLVGSLYNGNSGYDGVGVNTPEGVFSIGTYGTWGAATYGVPDWKHDRNLFWAHTNNYATWFRENLPGADYFLYLEDEPGTQDFGTVNTWAQWMKQNPGPGQNMASFVTYPFSLASRDMPDVDIPVIAGGIGVCPSVPCDNTTFNQTWADFYRTSPRHKLWAYNAGRPGTGTFMTEDDGISPRMIPWAQYKMQIGRWFYWYANVNTPWDFFQQAVTWGDNQFYDPLIGLTGNNGTSNGDGLIVYPGSSVYAGQTNYRLDGPIASIRLKEWRRGIQDVDYLSLAAKYNPAATSAIVASTVPKVLWEYQTDNPSFYIGQGPAWSSDPDVWESARMRLLQIIVEHCRTSSASFEPDSPCTWDLDSSSSTSEPASPANSGSPSPDPTQTNPDSSSTTSPAAGETTGLVFVPVTPCRVLDTRNGEGEFGGPSLSPHSIRLIPIVASQCNIPATAASFAVNVTVVPERKLDFLTIYPAGNSLPTVSLVNSLDGRAKAIAAIVAAGASGNIAAFATDTTQLIIDINGYFVPSNVATGLRFFPVKPCRVFDTRSQDSSNRGVLEAGEQREFRILTSPCGIPSNARAYSLNYTAVPREKALRWVSAWPAGNPMPGTSTLNAPTGAVTANGSITPAGTNGNISVYVTDRTDLIVDINGYFAPDATGGLLLYNITPCRMLDSRVADTPSESLGTMLLDFGGSACGIPATASAALTNITAVPMEGLEFLSVGPPAWDIKSSSLLNAYDGQIASNIALLPLTGGYADAYTTNRTHLIVDVFGYFAP